MSEPARLADSPWRDRLDDAVKRRGFGLRWYRGLSDDRHLGLSASIVDRDGRVVKGRAITVWRAHGRCEGSVAEAVAQELMDVD